MDFITDLPPQHKIGGKNIINNYGSVKQKGYFNSNIIDIYPRGNHGLYKALHSVPRISKGDY